MIFCLCYAIFLCANRTNEGDVWVMNVFYELLIKINFSSFWSKL